jgi:hypothetical protein
MDCGLFTRVDGLKKVSLKIESMSSFLRKRTNPNEFRGFLMAKIG